MKNRNIEGLTPFVIPNFGGVIIGDIVHHTFVKNPVANIKWLGGRL
jgi:hypothetical protein